MTRAVTISLISFALMTLLGPVWSLVAFQQVSVDVSVIVVVYVALSGRRGGFSRASFGPTSALLEPTGVVTVLLLGYLAAVLDGGSPGLQGIALGLVYVLSRAIGKRIFLVGLASQIAMTLAGAIVVVLTILCARWLGGVQPSVHVLPIALGQVVLTALAAPPIMALLRLLDGWLSRRRLGEPTALS